MGSDVLGCAYSDHRELAMEIRCVSSIPLGDDEPVSAIKQFLGILRNCAVDTERAQIAINLPGISARAKAARAKIRPEETEGCNFEQALAIVERLTALGAAERSSLPIILSANDFRWRDSAASTSASLLLLDGKTFQRKKRFELVATFAFEASDLKDPAVTSMIERVSSATRIRFRPENAGISVGTDEPGRATATELLAIDLSWNEVIEDATEKVRSGISLAGFPHLMTSAESIDFRFDRSKLGKSVRVDFRRMVRRWLKDEFPDYKGASGPWDIELLQKPLAEGLLSALGVDKRPGAFSKEFEIQIGVALSCPRFAPLPDRPFRIIENLFRLFGIGPLPLKWTYFTEEDLRKALSGAAILIKQVLGIFEPASRAMQHAHERPIESFAGPRELTARQAYDLVLPTIKEWAQDAGLISLAAGTVGRHAMNSFRVQYPVWSSAGRLAESGVWILTFHSRSKEENVLVHVPSRGTISKIRGGAPRGRSWPSDFDHIMKDGWIDSGEAILRAQAEAFGKDLPSQLQLNETARLSSEANVIASWQAGPPFRDGMFKMEAAWRISFSTQQDEARNRIIRSVTIPAYGGPSTWEIRKFDRFGRPINR
jgi:hypothetical protein